jgi:adenylate cyclase
MMGEADERRMEKEIRALRKQVERLEASRATAEGMWDRNASLFRTLNEEIEERGRLIRLHKEQLELLAAKLAKYLSPQVYESIFTGERDVRIETYRKELTIFFSDIVGFTPTSERMEPAELAAWLNPYLNDMARLCVEFEGTLDKFIGDAVMVFFGDPRTVGPAEDALRCVRMAVAMRKAARECGVNTRMGIHSGDTVVGNFGSEARMDYTVVGRTVNVAARLEGACEPGGILVSDTTYEHVKHEFRATPTGPLTLKGVAEPVSAWALDVEG